MHLNSAPGSSVGIVTDYGLDGPGSNPGRDEIFRTRSDRPWGPHSLLWNGYRVFPVGKVRPERAADHLPPSSACNGKPLPFLYTPQIRLNINRLIATIRPNLYTNHP